VYKMLKNDKVNNMPLSMNVAFIMGKILGMGNKHDGLYNSVYYQYQDFFSEDADRQSVTVDDLLKKLSLRTTQTDYTLSIKYNDGYVEHKGYKFPKRNSEAVIKLIDFIED